MNGRRSSVVQHGWNSAADDGTHDIEKRDTEDFPRSLGLTVSPLEYDVRTSVLAVRRLLSA